MKKSLLFLLSATSGILLSLSWLIPGLGWVLFFSFVPLLIIENYISIHRDHNSNSFFHYSYITFLLWNLLATWWIGYVSFIGMLLIAGLNALLMTIVWWLTHLIHRKSSVQTGYFSLIVFWIAFEYLQHHWAIPWPWLSLGNGFANTVKIIQWYEFSGVLGGSRWVLMVNILIYISFKSLYAQLFIKFFRQAAATIVVIFLPILMSLFLYFSYSEKGPTQNVIVLQPNINPYTEKFSGLNPEEQLEKLLSLVEENISDSTDLIVAPETSIPSIWEDSIQIQNLPLISIFDIINKYPRVCFIAGSLTSRKFRIGEDISETARQSADQRFYFDVFNSALMMDKSGQVQINHKSILVNGVERMPFQKYFSFLSKYNLNLGGTSGSLAAAKEPVLFLGNGDMKIGSVICFESAFGEYSGKLVQSGANLLVVITNDGWWKDSAGAWQHFGYSRLRAIESRRSIARSANTGISGFINQRGDILKRTIINTNTGISSPVRMNDDVTFYVLYGDYIGRWSLILSGLIVFYLAIIFGQKKSALIRL